MIWADPRHFLNKLPFKLLLVRTKEAVLHSLVESVMEEMVADKGIFKGPIVPLNLKLPNGKEKESLPGA